MKVSVKIREIESKKCRYPTTYYGVIISNSKECFDALCLSDRCTLRVRGFDHSDVIIQSVEDEVLRLMVRKAVNEKQSDCDVSELALFDKKSSLKILKEECGHLLKLLKEG